MKEEGGQGRGGGGRGQGCFVGVVEVEGRLRHVIVEDSGDVQG